MASAGVVEVEPRWLGSVEQGREEDLWRPSSRCSERRCVCRCGRERKGGEEPSRARGGKAVPLCPGSSKQGDVPVRLEQAEQEMCVLPGSMSGGQEKAHWHGSEGEEGIVMPGRERDGGVMRSLLPGACFDAQTRSKKEKLRWWLDASGKTIDVFRVRAALLGKAGGKRLDVVIKKSFFWLLLSRMQRRDLAGTAPLFLDGASSFRPDT